MHQRKITVETKLFVSFFLIAVFGGALRKWFVSSNAVGNVILLLQIVFPFFFLLLRSPKAKLPFGYFKVLTFFIIYLLFQVINPYQLTLFHGMVGFLIYGGFWVLTFYYVKNRENFQLDRLLFLFLTAAIIETILGFIQYVLPGSHFLNRYANEEAVSNIAIVGDSVRITGTFSYISGFTAYLMFFNLMAWGMLLKGYKNWLVVLTFGAGLVLAFMSGSRSAVFLYVGLTGILVARSFSPVQLFRFALYSIIPMAIALAILLASGKNVVTDRITRATNNFVERMTSLQESGEQNKRFTWGLNKLNDSQRLVSPWIGLGTASTYQGTAALFGKSRDVISFGYIESEFVQVILEGGIILFLFRIALVITLLSNLSYPLSIKVFLIVLLLYGFPTVFNVHNASFMMMGLMLTDNLIWRNQQEALRKKQGLKEGEDLVVKPISLSTPSYGYPQVFDKPVV
jgi:hypothetical protein